MGFSALRESAPSEEAVRTLRSCSCPGIEVVGVDGIGIDVRRCGVSFLRTLGGSLEANELEVDGGDDPQELMEGEPIDGEQVVEGDVTQAG